MVAGGFVLWGLSSWELVGRLEAPHLIDSISPAQYPKLSVDPNKIQFLTNEQKLLPQHLFGPMNLD
ncbi:hypothetical protein Fmac_000507 [Flemingia macrophylla]|uniref:Uncharacterized protein n=1 Tax=Flemingia macrophylla TaxID=520843 RepID=A0ABD1NEG2_9FABA